MINVSHVKSFCQLKMGQFLVFLEKFQTCKVHDRYFFYLTNWFKNKKTQIKSSLLFESDVGLNKVSCISFLGPSCWPIKAPANPFPVLTRVQRHDDMAFPVGHHRWATGTIFCLLPVPRLKNRYLFP